MNIGLDMAQGYQNFGANGAGFWLNNPGLTYDTLTPAQQNWYNEQIQNSNAWINPGGGRNWWYNPASFTALSTPAAAAPAPVAPAAATPAPVAPSL